MARISELAGLGMHPLLAAAVGGMENTAGASGAGTAQADATVLSTPTTRFTTVNSGTGAILPNAAGKGPYTVVNAGSNPLLVYPAVGETINGGSANASFSVTNAKRAVFIPCGTDWVAILSA